VEVDISLATSTSVSKPLTKARTLRPVSRSTGSQRARDLGGLEEQAQVAKPLVLAQPAQAPLSRRQRLSSVTTMMSGPAQLVRVCVGPRPNWSL
jgi:hypothetical protein